MRTRIRYISHKRKGKVVQEEKLVNKQVITVGRATDQDIFLSDLGVAYHHVRLSLSASGQIGISSLSTAGIYVNGRFVQSGSLKGRGEITVGPYSIKIERGSGDVDFEITIEKFAEDIVEVQAESLPAMKLEDTWVSKRSGAWLVFIVILALFMGLPLAGFYNKDVDTIIQQSAFIPDDGSWLTGDISSPHRYFGNNCHSCHVNAFELVRDDACLECHGDSSVHADPEIIELHTLHETRCATCHKEHSGNAFLVRRDQQLCSDCHQDLNRHIETELANVSDIEHNHPQFSPLLYNKPEFGVNDVRGWNRVDLDDPNIWHETGLKFPHDIHLDINGLESPGGRVVLECNDCHKADVAGGYMLPIQMEQHCQNCHRLDFDIETPKRQLPHGDLEQLRATLQEYYAYMALKGGQDEHGSPAVVQQRRRPGKELTTSQRKAALNWAKEKAADIEEDVIEFRACGLCHKVSRQPQLEHGWHVPDVQISQRWLTKGAFDHASHRSTVCTDCHYADKSGKSEQVLLPGIKVCRECHGGEYTANQIESGCVMCHQFHVPDNLLYRDKQQVMEYSQ